MANIRTNSQYEEIRTFLETRNLFTPENPYELNSPKLVRAVNSIAGLIPGKSFDLSNTLIGRLMGPNTPIAAIGLQQYSKHLAQSVVSNVMSDSIPSVNFTNLFDGDPNTRLITKKEDYRITRDETKTSIGRILEDITNQQPKLASSVFTGRGNLAPFDKFPNQFDYIRNTGKGQLNQYYASIDKNIYVQSSEDFIEASSNQGYKVNKVTKALLNKTFYPTNDPFNFPDGQAASDDVRSEIVLLREESPAQSVSEYGSAAVSDSMGKTKKQTTSALAQNLPNQERADDFEFNDDSYGFIEDVDNQIVWGRDTDLKNKYGVRSGALLYTKGLLQAKGNRGYFDMTKKKFTDPQGQLMYNGSPLTRHIDGTVDRSRQHTVLDQYDRYAKAIRFTGNSIYNAPAESVINRTVIPKFHPIIDTSSNINNKNLMFSIENLAYVLNDKGYLGDVLGTKVPQSEVGYNKGRLMWFAPYDVEVSETAAAKYETTQFIGRSEPVYSYQSSERSARLSFKLIIDYPPQVDGRSHGDNAKFFAFGGRFSENQYKNVDIDKERASLVELENRLKSIQPTETLLPPENLKAGDAAIFFFQNDGRSVDSAIEEGYEDGIQTEAEENDDKLNQTFITSVNTLVNETLTPENFKYYSISFLGRASRLYYNKATEKGYNKQLGLDRANSLMKYVEKQFSSVNKGLTFAKAGIKVNVATIGSDSGSTEGTLEQNISLLKVKQERNALVRLVPNGTLERKTVPLTSSQLQDKAALEQQIADKKELIAIATKAQSNERIFVERNGGDRAMKGFEAMKKITLSPVFHSQTPEDFHRRLTFLHQCTRQGNAVVNSTSTNSGISVPRNSVFGRPPICVLRLGDMFHSKVVIETVDFDYSESIWDLNPEGMGMQFMIANIDISMKIIGGQSLKGAIDVIQNAESFNYYANSTYYGDGVYKSARKVEDAQIQGDSTLINAKQQARFGSNTNGDSGAYIPL
jgi:hypothetical protein